ncbi:MAG: sulfite exporter TauE/SafE family protein [Bacteroidota bacterium]|nr:sulfite exporter TauE/SafE family protein [Bacteroidota bacterium]
MEYFLAAITLGLLSGFHCIGMCGPIAMALPVHKKTSTLKVISILAYNFGRVITYSLFGVVFGLIGQSFSFFGLQQKLSIILGIGILIFLIFPYLSIKPNAFYFNFINKIKTKISSLFNKNDLGSLFGIGLLNGLLPCGMVYIALAGALVGQTAFHSMLFMAVFGLGTIPFMFSVSYISQFISLKARNTIKKVQPFIIAIMAVLLIVRGLNLGIDHLSPKLNEELGSQRVCKQQIQCCPKK